jgi:hypothetical protein
MGGLALPSPPHRHCLQRLGRLWPVRIGKFGALNPPVGSIAEPPGNFHLSAFLAHSAAGRPCFKQTL